MTMNKMTMKYLIIQDDNKITMKKMTKRYLIVQDDNEMTMKKMTIKITIEYLIVQDDESSKACIGSMQSLLGKPAIRSLLVRRESMKRQLSFLVVVHEKSNIIVGWSQ